MEKTLDDALDAALGEVKGARAHLDAALTLAGRGGPPSAADQTAWAQAQERTLAAARHHLWRTERGAST